MSRSIRALAWIAVIATSAALPGCATASMAPEPPAPPAEAVEGVSAASLARSLDLGDPIVVGDSARIVLGPAAGDRVLLFPGTRVVTIRGERYETSHRVELRDGQAWLFPDDADGIVGIWKSTAASEKASPGKDPAGVLPPPPAPLEPSPDPPPVPESLGRVVIDPGHGGTDPGASSASGLLEKDVCLDVALELARVLQAEGVEVRLTRSADRFVELEERAAVGNRNQADVFVSIHADAAGNASASGFSVYIRRVASTRSFQLAEAIRGSMRDTGANDRGVRRADYRVLSRSVGPAALVELGFLSNRRDAADLATSNYRDVLARLVGAGILEFLRR